jgi:hypothetical protein
MFRLSCANRTPEQENRKETKKEKRIILLYIDE